MFLVLKFVAFFLIILVVRRCVTSKIIEEPASRIKLTVNLVTIILIFVLDCET